MLFQTSTCQVYLKLKFVKSFHEICYEFCPRLTQANIDGTNRNLAENDVLHQFFGVFFVQDHEFSPDAKQPEQGHTTTSGNHNSVVEDLSNEKNGANVETSKPFNRLSNNHRRYAQDQNQEQA